jgi:group II intron reverse transcriptase/maturase
MAKAGREPMGLTMTQEPSVDTDDRADEAWLLSIQRKLYQWSEANPGGCYRELWNWVTDPRNLRCAWRQIASNRGARTAGVDGKTVGRICATTGREAFLQELRDDLRAGRYRPSPCRRKWIPKPGKPGQFRPLGIPTVADRLVQCAIKNLLEPIFEATFWHVSYGFRPGRGGHGALEHIRMTMRPRAKADDGRRHRAPYQWVIEGDIKGCFDHIDHHRLMQRVRARIGDLKVTRVVGQFLKAGVLEEGFLHPTHEGTPQGGVISPLLANIALSAIEERYERWVHHRTKIQSRRTCDGITAANRCRMTDRRRGVPVFVPVRYADDFVILVAGEREDAEAEKAALAQYLHEVTGLTLSTEKTRIADLREGFEFLGHRVRLKWHPTFGLMPRIEIPKHKQADLRHRVKTETRRDSLRRSLTDRLQRLNPILRGWGHYYRFCTGAGAVFSNLDQYVGDRLWRWLMKKHKGLRRQRSSIRRQPSLVRPTRKVWREGNTEQFLLGTLRVQRFRRGWMLLPRFAHIPGEPDA